MKIKDKNDIKLKMFGYEKTEKELNPVLVNEIRKYITLIEIILLIIVYKLATWIW